MGQLTFSNPLINTLYEIKLQAADGGVSQEKYEIACHDENLSPIRVNLFYISW